MGRDVPIHLWSVVFGVMCWPMALMPVTGSLVAGVRLTQLFSEHHFLAKWGKFQGCHSHCLSQVGVAPTEGVGADKGLPSM